VNIFKTKSYESGQPILTNEVSYVFASFFAKKKKNVVDSVPIDEAVYNAEKMVDSSNKMFMDSNSCMLLLEQTNSKGYNHIQQRILIDGTEHLLPPLTRCLTQSTI
jgi:hypothetical protein